MQIIDKNELIRLILEKLNIELQTTALSAKAAHEAATHEESKAEDSHDTRGLEASYLAGAQNARIEALKKMIASFQFAEIRSFQTSDPIGLGACVELDLNGKRLFYFLASQGGGVTISVHEKIIHVITPEAPLGEALLDKYMGDEVEVESMKANRVYEIMSVC